MKKTKILLAIVLSIALLAVVGSFTVPVSAADETFSTSNVWGDAGVRTSLGTVALGGGTWYANGFANGYCFEVEASGDFIQTRTMTLPDGKVLKSISLKNMWGPANLIANVTLKADDGREVKITHANDSTPWDGFGIAYQTNWTAATKVVTITVEGANMSPLTHTGHVTRIVIGDDDGSTLPPTTTAEPTTTVTTTKEPTTTAEPTITDDPTTTDEATTTEPPAGTKGDINGDGKVNGMDLLLMKQHILDVPDKKIAEGTAAFWAADMNDDDKINGMDLLLLKKEILK